MKYFPVLAILLLFCTPSAKGMCQVPQPRLVCAEYFASKVVVEATLTRIKTIREESDPEGAIAHEYRLETKQKFRGHIGPVFKVYESNDSGRAGFDWKTGQEYLLFLFYTRSDKAWVLDGCGNSGPL